MKLKGEEDGKEKMGSKEGEQTRVIEEVNMIKYII
jgi:hypothetical protein